MQAQDVAWDTAFSDSYRIESDIAQQVNLRIRDKRMEKLKRSDFMKPSRNEAQLYSD